RRHLAAGELHVPPSPQGWRKVGAALAHGGAALGLSAARPVADRMGAQHSAARDAALLDHLPQHGAAGRTRGRMITPSCAATPLRYGGSGYLILPNRLR